MASETGKPSGTWRKKWDSFQAESVPILHVTDFWVKAFPDEMVISWGQVNGPYVNEYSPQEDIDELGGDTWAIHCVSRVGLSRQAAINLRDTLSQLLDRE